MEQEDFDFLVTDTSTPHMEPSRKRVKVPRESTSLCAWCGQLMPSALLDTNPPVDDNRWAIAAPYHAPTCRWIATKGLRLGEGSQT
jgi:hypothetical protein